LVLDFLGLSSRSSESQKESSGPGVGNGLGGYHYFGEMGARPKQLGFGEVAPTLGRDGFFSGIRLTRGGLGAKIPTVGRAALLRSRRQMVEEVELPAGNSQEDVDRLPAGNAGTSRSRLYSDALLDSQTPTFFDS
jgi:hypothetical protein